MKFRAKCTLLPIPHTKTNLKQGTVSQSTRPNILRLDLQNQKPISHLGCGVVMLLRKLIEFPKKGPVKQRNATSNPWRIRKCMLVP